MAKSIMDLLGESSSINTLISILFKAQMEAHITHILQRKKLLCEHEALATFYEEVEDIIDVFAETCMAHGLVSNISIPACMEILDTEAYFKNLYAQVESYRGEVSKIPFLVSKLDDLQELISQTTYRLKFIHS